MIPSPLVEHVLFRVGPIPVATAVVTTWGIIAVMALGAWLATRRLALHAGRAQAVVELVVTGLEGQIEDIIHADGRRLLPLSGTIFLFLVVANLCAVVPGLHPPTAHLETTAALAAIVFFAVHVYGVRSRGLGGYLRSFARPTVLMLPINILSDFTRILSLMVRLFGNIMSGEFIIAIVIALAGLLVPIPLMALEVLTGLVQAYIFAVLATVFIGAALGTVEKE